MQFKNTFYCLIYCLFVVTITKAQTHNGTISIQSQVDLDNLPEYERITGSLVLGYLYSNNQSDIHDLSAFKKLKFVGGRFEIQRTKLKNLHHLDSLRTILGDYINFSQNDSLETLSGLDQLAEFTPADIISSMDMNIYKNPRLRTLAHFTGIDSLPGSLFITENALESLDGFDSLKYVFDDILLIKNQLKNIKALHNLQTSNELHISYENQLESIEGLENWTSVRDNYTEVYIEYCPRIKNILPLVNLKPNRFGLLLVRNDSLLDVSGMTLPAKVEGIVISGNPLVKEVVFPHVTHISSLVVTFNDQLTKFAFDSLVGSATWAAAMSFGYNPRLKKIALPLFGNPVAWGPPGTPGADFIQILNNDSLEVIDFPLIRHHAPGIYIRNNKRLRTIYIPDIRDTYHLPSGQARGFEIQYGDSLSGYNFPKLGFVGQNFYLDENMVKEIPVFDSLRIVMKESHIQDSFFISIKGFPNLQKTLKLDISAKTAILEMCDLPKIDSCWFTFGCGGYYGNNYPSINNFTLPSLKFSVYVELGFGTGQKDLPGIFPALNTVDFIGANGDSLVSIDGFSTVKKVTTTGYFKNNPFLTDCSAICDIMSYGNTNASVFNLTGNPASCLSVPAILTYCDTVTAVTEPTDLPTTKLAVSLNISPNPTKDVFLCETDLKGQTDGWLCIYNLNGELMDIEQLTTPQEQVAFNTKDWPSGVYAVHIETLRGRVVRKLLVLP
jgi:Secretion system C-terminal sorting domain/Receptor L domain